MAKNLLFIQFTNARKKNSSDTFVRMAAELSITKNTFMKLRRADPTLSDVLKLKIEGWTGSEVPAVSWLDIIRQGQYEKQSDEKISINKILTS